MTLGYDVGPSDASLVLDSTGTPDMESLRAKYSQPREALRAQVNSAPQSSGHNVSAAQSAAMASIETSQRLNDIHMCQQCQAFGVIKVQYGYRVIDEQCPACGGEGIVRAGQGKPASDELKEKVAQVEALIEQVEDLDELERLEEALTKRSLKALNAVLKPSDKPSGGAAAAPAEGQVV